MEIIYKSLKENIKAENAIVYLEEILEHIIHACIDANIVTPMQHEAGQMEPKVAQSGFALADWWG